MQKNKEAVIHFTKIARDRFQIYDFRDKSNKITNTRDLASYLANLRGGQTLDNSFYSKLISMPNFSTIAISKDALNITKKASATKLEPWKLEKTADGEVFVSAIEDEEDKEDLKKCASSNLKHKYVISITAKNEDQKIRTYASIKKSACIPEMCIEINPVSDCVNFDYESEKTPYDVIDEIVGILANVGLVIDPKQIECCHDFCDCGMDQVGPVVPCENNEFILDCYDQKPIVGQSVESLQSYAEAHNRKHFKIYAYDRVVFDSDATIKVKAEDNNKSLFTLYLYSDTDNFVESRDFHTFKEASDSFLQIQKEMADRKTDPVLINYMKIKETTDNGEKVLKSWEGADPGNLIPSEAETEAVVETETKTETETSNPAPLPTSEAKEEVEEKVETPEGQKLEEKLEEKVEETVKASAKGGLEKKAEENNEEPSVSQETIQKYKEHGFVEKGSPEYNEFYNAGFTMKQSLFDKNHYYVIELERERRASSKKEDLAKKALLITTEDFSDYKPWSGAVDTYNTIRDAGKLDALESYLEELYPEGIDMTQINDILWFDGDQVLEALGISDEEDIEDEAKDNSADIEKKSEINADPKVVIDKLEKGDLLPGTAERKEGLEKVVNDKEYKEDVKELKDKGAITEKEIKEVKKEDINKESKVVKQDGKYQAQSEKGKNFGTYDTKQEAEDRVKQMEMFKHMKKNADSENADEYTEVVKEVTGATDVKPTLDTYGLKTYEAESEEWAVTDNYKEVEAAVKEDIKNLLDDLGVDALMWDNMGGIENYLDPKWFEEARQESNKSYAEDILSSEPKRFIEEAKELKLDTDYAGYELNDPEGDHSAAISDFAEAMKEQQEENPIEWYINNIGKDSIKDLVKAGHISFDIDAIVEKIMELDGPGHVISVYDGKMVEKDHNGKTYYLFRMASKNSKLNKKAGEQKEYHTEIYTKLDPDNNAEGFDAERHDHEYFKTLEEAKAWGAEHTKDGKHYYEILLDDKVVYSSEKEDITKEADKVLIDKNTNQPIKPGESTEGKELKEVEVEKSTTTASNAVYNLFMKSAKINVNAQELRLLTAAYNSNLFNKVAYFGPTAFSFADNDATFIVENGTATCHKTADLTEVEIDKAIKEDPKPATKNEAEDFIKELNKELEVK